MNDAELAVDEIDGSFVPRPRSDIAFTEIEDELVITAPIKDQHFHTFDSHWLDKRASIVWHLFDGTTPIDEVAGLISTAFDADPDVVRDDVLTLTRTLAAAGLFEGVRAERPTPHVGHQPQGLPIGSELPLVESIDLDGREFTAGDFRGHPTLLVNWSPTCGYCTRIAGELADLGPDLEAQGVKVVLLTRGTAEDNRRVREESGLSYPLLPESGFQLFVGVGTPSAYMADEDGRVASQLFIGADQVAGLARRSAGRDTNLEPSAG